jgi:hypothetical protein
VAAPSNVWVGSPDTWHPDEVDILPGRIGAIRCTLAGREYVFLEPHEQDPSAVEQSADPKDLAVHMVWEFGEKHLKHLIDAILRELSHTSFCSPVSVEERDREYKHDILFCDIVVKGKHEKLPMYIEYSPFNGISIEYMYRFEVKPFRDALLNEDGSFTLLRMRD